MIKTENCAPKIALAAGLNRHEEEALIKLMKRNQKKAAVLYLVGIRKRLDVHSGVAGDARPLTAHWLLERLQRNTGRWTLSELLHQLERVRLIEPLPSPAGNFRFLLTQVDRIKPGQVA